MDSGPRDLRAMELELKKLRPRGMTKQRCPSCQKVFDAQESDSPSKKLRCPDCGESWIPSSQVKSLAGDSGMVGTVETDHSQQSPQQSELAEPSYEAPEQVVYCPVCKVRLQVNLRKYGGKRVKCPACKKGFRMPNLQVRAD